MLQKSNLYLLLLYHFVWIIRVYSSHPVTVLELAIPQPPISIFRRDEESIVSKCRHFVRQAVESNYHVTHLMKLAVCLHQVQLTHEAMDLYQYIHNEHPDYSFVLANMALLSLTSGEPHQAKKLLDLYFQQVGGLYGDKLSPIQDRDARIYGPACTPTAMYKSDCVYALNLYASTHMQLANNSFAQTLYRRALELADENDTSLSSIYANLGDLLGNLGDDQGAADSFIKAFWKSFQGEKINPGLLIRRAILVPSISSSIEQAINLQRRFDTRIEGLTKIIEYGGVTIGDDSSDLFRVSANISFSDMIDIVPPLSSSLDNWAMNIQIPHFFLHYYGFHDRRSNEVVSAMYRKVSVSTLQKSYINSASYSSLITGRERKRIVFVSCLVGGDEPHGLLIIDILKRLPKDIFETIALGVGMQRPTSEFLDAVVNYYHVGNDSAKASSLLASLQPDCVVFMEHVNNGIMQFLLFQRYAPIQMLAMGAPVTSGVSSIDYFLSGDRLEHPFRTQLSGDQSSYEPYTEQVVLLDGQAISFPKNQFFPAQDDRLAAGEASGTVTALGINTNFTTDNFGIPLLNSSVPVYMCFQSLFKLHPLFDTVITKILLADQRGIIVLQSARDMSRTKIVMDRLVQSVSTDVCMDDSSPCSKAKAILSRIYFIPRVKSNKLSQLFQKATVVLHPFPFDGSKTASDVLNASVPLVTFPQEYLRGRMAQNFYATMALYEIDEDVAASTCCIASDLSDYISKVIRLGQDQQYRDKVVNAISLRRNRIFDDHQVAFEWSRFLSRALGVKISAEDLAHKMNYNPERWQEDKVLDMEMIRLQKLWKRSLAVEHLLRRRVLL